MTSEHTAPEPRSAISLGKAGPVPRVAGAVISVVILCTALWFLHRELSSLRPDAIYGQIRSIPLRDMLLAVGFAACSYLVLTGYDAAAIRYVGQQLRYRHTAITAFMAYAVGHNVGIAALSGGSIRYRMYSSLGLSASEIARIILFVTLTFGLGASLLVGVAMILMPPEHTEMLGLPPLLLHLTGILLVAVPLFYLLMILVRRAPFVIAGWQLSLPRPSIAFAQIGLSIADLTFAAAALYVLIASEIHIGFFPFLGIYLLAMAAGLVSSIPGGIGVFEAVLFIALPQVDRSMLLGTVIVYRLIYYVAPLSLAMLLLVTHELEQHRQFLRKSTTRVGRWLSSIAPQVVSLAVFLAGVVLLVSGSTPAVAHRLNFIAKGIPLPVLELSHLTGSIMGVGLLIVARGLYRRLQGAYFAALAVLAVGIFVSLLKGLDYEEALILGAVIGFLWLSRNEFYRQGTLASEHFAPVWVGSIALVLCIAVWIGLFNFRHIQYSDQLWWQFALHADAPRTLRASVVAAITAMGFAFWKLLRAGTALSLETAASDMERVRRVVRGASDASANAALLGDKRFLWSAGQEAFIMYQLSGNSWIALGDPVGPASAREELAWSFREMVYRYDGRAVFYQVSDESLPLYVDMGFTLAKLGEDARVPLGDFSLEGSRRADLRQACNRVERKGAIFDIVPSAEIGSIAPELRRVSDSWLEEKGAGEKGFSLGSFSEEYVSNFDCAIVRIDEAIIAFANLWAAPAGGELSVDMMRHDRSAPNGLMDYLFCRLMLWGKTQGYTWFSLGMAPLSGLEQRSLAPLWHRIGHLIFSHGESFYNFEGLRAYKEKFEPEWRPRYIASPGGLLTLPRALLDTARLISGGVTKIIAK